MAELPLKIDLHMHSTVSDGTDTPQELLKKVSSAGMTVFSVTDHDAVKAGGVIRGCLKDGDPQFIQGAEFSCRDGEGKYHILGYGFDPENGFVNDLVERAHGLRMKKVRARLDFLESEFGFTFPKEEIDRLLSQDNPGKPHIGNLMVKYGYAVSKESAIKDYIDRKHFKNEYISPSEAIEGIIKGGGIPVLAHPFFGSGDELILGEDMDKRVKRLVGYGLKGIESFYSGFSAKLIRDALDLSEKHGLYVTAGSDYHGKNKLVILGDTGFDGSDGIPQGMRRFFKDLNINV
ncbi:MAG: PHP domain-containing protein [Clostridia bacterium]|nr:PHP domain-containing protein [Clostridia bacterium]